jgi:hypothetical protein
VPSGSPAGQPVVLDVPYLPQSVLLCGGAAVAMVERWWGQRGVYAEDFASLIRPVSGGILTTDLESATRARGWDTRTVRGTPELVQRSLRDGVPVVALIQVGGDRYHYVVVLGWRDGQVVVHDPATAPFTTIEEDSFLARWAGADWWALLVRPAPVATVPPGTDSTAQASTVPAMPCPPWIDQALDAVAANRLDDASGLLAEAGQACPLEPLVLRETAAVRFKQGLHQEAIRVVSSYLALVPGDELGWHLLATSLYLVGDEDGALRAWNRVGRPTVDIVRIHGVRTIRFREIAGAISLPPGTLLTPSGLALARRRVSDVPALHQATVNHEPVPGGMVEVQAAVVERPRVESFWRLAASGAVRAIAQREVGLEVASPSGGGELWTGSWRWEAARPRGVLRGDVPADPGIPGILSIEGAWERFRFALDDSETEVFEDTRRSAMVGFGGWVTPALRPSAALRLERWSGNRRHLAASVGAVLRARDNRLQMAFKTEHAFALSAHPSYTSAGIRAAWASSLGLGRSGWSARSGFDWAGSQAPPGTWPVAGGALPWTVPLRAHVPTDGGYLVGRGVGRGIIHAGLAGDRTLYRTGPLLFAAGLFLDAARVVDAVDASPGAHFYLDGGGGLRIGLVEGELGVLRIDLARSLVTDGQFALTVGVHQGWPLFHEGY